MNRYYETLLNQEDGENIDIEVPKFIIVLNCYDIKENSYSSCETNVSDGSIDEQEEMRDNIRNLLARKIIQNVHDNRFEYQNEIQKMQSVDDFDRN